MILVTGAGGFIGSGLATRLQAAGTDVLPLARSENFSAGKGRLALDLSSRDHTGRLKASGIRADTVVHLAGHIEIALKPGTGSAVAPVPGREDIAAIYDANLLATINLLDYCLASGTKHLIFASSQTVYGMPPSEHITEETPKSPLEHYAMSKACCENVLRLAASEDLAVTVLRFPGVYSEARQSGAVYRFCESARREKKIRVTSDIPLPFDIIHRDDVLDALERVIAKPGSGFSVYNIATGEPCSLDILADRVASLVPGCSVEHAPIPQPVIRMDSERAYRAFGWKAQPSSVRLKQVLDSVIP